MHKEQSWALKSVNWFSVIQTLALFPFPLCHGVWGSLSLLVSLGFSLYAPTLKHQHQLRIGNWRTHPNPYLGAHILCLDPMLCCCEDAVMVQIEPKLYLQPDKPGCIYTLPRGLEPQHSQFLHVNQTPHVVFNQRRAETRMFWWENELSTLAPPSGKCSSLSVCRTQDFCLPIDF